MTKQEFQLKYHEYCVGDAKEAEREAGRANAIGIDGDVAVVVEFQAIGCGLMLKSAADFIDWACSCR